MLNFQNQQSYEGYTQDYRETSFYYHGMRILISNHKQIQEQNQVILYTCHYYKLDLGGFWTSLCISCVLMHFVSQGINTDRYYNSSGCMLDQRRLAQYLLIGQSTVLKVAFKQHVMTAVYSSLTEFAHSSFA